MIVANSNIATDSSHDLEVSHQESVLRRITTRRALPEGRRPPENESVDSASSRQAPRDGVKVTLSQQAAIQSSFYATGTDSASTITDSPEDGATSEQRIKLSVLLKTLEKMTGKSYHFSETRFQPASDSPAAESQPMGNIPSGGISSSSRSSLEVSQNTAGTQVETLTAYRHNETEKTTFAAAGTIMTSDGREIEMKVELQMSREFHEANVDYSIESRPLTDPLVINVAGGAAELTEKKYAFDLNSDGVDEQISFVIPATGGFLAHDRNRDGVINNGGELFGPTQGNGFSELAAYDEDGNGWIDAADGVFYDLSIWSKTTDGNDQLIAVADTGIGAIYLNAVDTPFAITTGGNEKLGQVRASSVYLNENGSAGVIQQVDLVE